MAKTAEEIRKKLDEMREKVRDKDARAKAKARGASAPSPPQE